MAPFHNFIYHVLFEPAAQCVNNCLWEAVIAAASFGVYSSQPVKVFVCEIRGFSGVWACSLTPKRPAAFSEFVQHYSLLRGFVVIRQAIETDQILSGEESKILTQVINKTRQGNPVFVFVVH